MRILHLMQRVMLAGVLILTAAAPSAQTVQALAEKQYSDFNNLRALFGRFYVHTLFAGLKQACPNYPESFAPPPFDVLEYLNYRRLDGPDVNRAVEALGVAMEMRVYTAVHDGVEEIKALAREKGCAKSVHAGWIAGAHQYLQDKELGGFVQAEINQACEAVATRGDCGCFAKQFDWESTPGQRKSVLGNKDKEFALRNLVRDGETRQRLSYRRAGLPHFGNAHVAAASRGISVGRYEGYFRSRQVRRPEPFVCLFTSTGTPNQFRVRCGKGYGSREVAGTAVQDGTAVTFSWIDAPLMPTTWQLSSDGGIKSSIDPKWRFEYVLGPQQVK